jgi:hypothetical protein
MRDGTRVSGAILPAKSLEHPDEIDVICRMEARGSSVYTGEYLLGIGRVEFWPVDVKVELVIKLQRVIGSLLLHLAQNLRSLHPKRGNETTPFHDFMLILEVPSWSYNMCQLVVVQICVSRAIRIEKLFEVLSVVWFVGAR